MNKKVTALLMSLLTLTANATNLPEKEKPSHHRVGATGALANNTWQWEFSYHYMFCPYIGIGTGIGMWGQIASEGYPSGKDWSINDYYEGTKNGYLRPSIVLRSPILLKTKQLDCGLFAEPGLMMSLPEVNVQIDLYYQDYPVEHRFISSSKGQWGAIDCRMGVYLNVEHVDITLGWFLSGHDIYSYRRNLEYAGEKFNQFYPKKQLWQGAFLTLSYTF